MFQAIEGTRDHVFVTGRAGTGKSTLLNHLNWHTEKQIVICAPTGVAALNVGGQTIHSLFRLPIGVIADDEIDQNDAIRKLLNAIDTLVIDEVTMVSADLLDAIDRSLRQARHNRSSRSAAPRSCSSATRTSSPRCLVMGTSAPTSRTTTSRCGSSTRRCGGGDLRIFELDEIHRQHDAAFKLMLNAVRHGRVTAEIGGGSTPSGRRPLPEDGAITLATRNDTVNRINATELHRLRGTSQANEAEVKATSPVARTRPTCGSSSKSARR